MVTIWLRWCSMARRQREDHIELRSDYNLLIALRRITPEDFAAGTGAYARMQRLGHPLPVYFTVEELSDAADVFSD